MKNLYFKFKGLTLGLLISMVIFSLGLPLRPVFAVDSTSISVNGTSIYTSGGGYNAGHGISGVSFNVDTKVLSFDNASLSSVEADGDLTINLTGTNTITSTGGSGKAISVQGNLIIKGENGARLTIDSENIALEIGSGKRLTIGDQDNLSNLITVTIATGTNVNADDTLTVDGNTYNYTPAGPPAGDPLTISIGGVLAIDETAHPQVTSASGSGWSITKGFMNIYQIEIDSGTTLGYITGTGDGAISINPSKGDINIGANSGYSINTNGKVNVLTGMGPVAGNIKLAGGIYTKGNVSIYDRDMTIGNSETSSTKGIEAGDLTADSGNLTIYTTGVAMQYYNQEPGEGEGMIIESSAGKNLTVETSNIATAHVSKVRVSGGGKIDLTYTTSLGTFTPEAAHWPWADLRGTAQENPEPTIVSCSEGTNAANKYKMTTGVNNFLLESTAGTLYQLGWGYGDSQDAVVKNGNVNVISANGYKFISGGFTDYSIEQGSTVTIELLPDYGYQYVSGGLNGSPTTPEAGKASYTFTMPGNNLHLSAIFEKKPDIINVKGDNVTGATISMPAGNINGNAKLTIQDTSDADKTAFKNAASGLTVGGYVDMSLNEVIYKGNNNDAWTTSITDLNKAMTVNLSLAKDLQGHTDYTVLRNHNGTITKLSATYNADTKTLSFNTDKYSTYAIAYDDNNPDTSGGIRKYQIIGLISLIGLCGTILFSKRKRTNPYKIQVYGKWY